MGESVKLEVAGAESLIIDVELALVDQRTDGPIRFDVRADGVELPYEALVTDGRLVNLPLADDALVIRERLDPEPLSV